MPRSGLRLTDLPFPKETEGCHVRVTAPTWDGWLAGAVVICTVVFMVVRQVVRALPRGPTPNPHEVQIAVLPYQSAVLHRPVAPPRYTPSDRLLSAALPKLLPHERWALSLVALLTLLRWHRELIARRWTYPP